MMSSFFNIYFKIAGFLFFFFIFLCLNSDIFISSLSEILFFLCPLELTSFLPPLKNSFWGAGNPASGVKPMYQVHVSPEKEKAHQQDAAAAGTNKSEKSEIRKHSIVKIDPKTLKPISEKAPETTSLSNHSPANQILSNHNQGYGTAGSQSHAGVAGANSHQGPAQVDLKINTSSVSIFNPLKLQSSPKNDRKSPKSPHSPKLKAQAAGSPTGSKRDKVRSEMVSRIVSTVGRIRTCFSTVLCSVNSLYVIFR